jgi:Ser/Thr protein kinase RdoA (MazF antagonist)
VSLEYSAAVIQDLHAMVGAALPRWGLSPATALSMLNLSENATFLLDDGRSRRQLIVRVHRVGYSCAEEIRSELAWIQALRTAAVIETAAPIAGVDGELLQLLPSPGQLAARHAVAFERLPGQEPDAGGDAAGWFEKLGGLTAKMHAHARQWPLPAGFVRKRWDVEAMVGPQCYWGPWRASLGLDNAGAAVIAAAIDRAKRRLEVFGRDAQNFGLVHADFRLANLLVEQDRLRIIDFDDCGFSWFLYDFATALSFIEHEAVVPALRDAWVKGYRTRATLSAQECAELPSFVILRRILLSAWLASHREIPFAQKLGSAFTADTVRLARQYTQGAFLN